MTKIVVIDYGMGNLRSVAKGLERVGGTVAVSADPREIFSADKLVLPGVGAIAVCMQNLKALGLVAGLKEWIAADRPFLGICLGYQALFTMSEEGGEVACLDVFPGRVVRFPHSELKVPHMGWNEVAVQSNHGGLLQAIPKNAAFYFVHSYYVEPADPSLVAATTEYGIRFASAIARGALFACQFHPEKSQAVGLQLLEAFVRN